MAVINRFGILYWLAWYIGSALSYFSLCAFVTVADVNNRYNNDDNDDVYADNTTIIVVSSVIGAVVLFALIFLFQFSR